MMMMMMMKMKKNKNKNKNKKNKSKNNKNKNNKNNNNKNKNKKKPKEKKRRKQNNKSRISCSYLLPFIFSMRCSTASRTCAKRRLPWRPASVEMHSRKGRRQVPLEGEKLGTGSNSQYHDNVKSKKKKKN
jgi:hypothetical protein